jgi:hypothetical protein
VSRLSVIADALATAIDAMTILGGYSADWNSVNIDDATQTNVFPQALVDITEETANIQDIHAGAYSNVATATIKVRDANTAAQTYPQRAIRTKLYADLDDLKKCFGSDPFLDSAGITMCEYQGMTIALTQKGDQHTSAEMTVTFQLTYSQDRTNPANPAC